ncbi:MAG: hypothetical protein J7M32_06070 [Deltaproteobacteria bacterium]|nr:hypothetical protein [Deltaproteobacteria bacterium]
MKSLNFHVWSLHISALVRESLITVIPAGGLSPENVYEAFMSLRPAGDYSRMLTNQVIKENKLLVSPQ